MMGLIAVCSNFLVGYGEHRTGIPLVLVLPLIISIPLFLIADIDSPRGALIRVLPQNSYIVIPNIEGAIKYRFGASMRCTWSGHGISQALTALGLLPPKPRIAGP